MTNDTRALVFAALDRADANGYRDSVMGDVEAVAYDLCDCEASLEGDEHTWTAILFAVVDWQAAARQRPPREAS